MSQTLGDSLGALTLSAAREDYWNDGKSMASWSVGYSNYWHNISYGLTWTYSKNVRSASENRKSQKTLTTTSFCRSTSAFRWINFCRRPWANYGMNASSNNGTTHNVGLERGGNSRTVP